MFSNDWRRVDLQTLQKEIQAGADVNIRNENGFTPLMFASRDNPNIEIIQTLIKVGVDVNAATNKGAIALMLAAATSPNLNLIKMLIEVGADVDAEAAFGVNAESSVLNNPNSKEILNIILNAKKTNK